MKTTEEFKGKLYAELRQKFFCTESTNEKNSIKPVSFYITKLEEVMNRVIFENLNLIIDEENKKESELKKLICSITFWIHFHTFTFRISDSKIDALTFFKVVNSAIISANENRL